MIGDQETAMRIELGGFDVNTGPDWKSRRAHDSGLPCQSNAFRDIFYPSVEVIS